MKRLAQFFEGERGALSMPRLLSFMAFFPASSVLIYIRTTEALSVYLAAYVTQYGAGRYFTMKGKQNVPAKPRKKL